MSSQYASQYKVNPTTNPRGDVTCGECAGRGQTRETRTETRRDKTTGVVTTAALGSGCPTCRGTGVSQR